MRHLVHDQLVRVPFELGHVGEHEVEERGRGGVLHATEDEVVYDDLIVARPGITTVDPRQELDHRRGASEGLAGERLGRAFGHDVAERDAVPCFGDGRGAHHHDGPQIRGHRLRLLPDGDVAFVALQTPVSDHRVPGGYGHAGGERVLHHRMVEAGEDEVRVFILALAPCLGSTRRLRRRRAYKIQAPTRRTVPRDDNLRERGHDELAVGVLPRERLASGVGDRVYGELIEVQRVLRRAGWHRGEPDLCASDQHLRHRINVQVEVQVLDVERAIGRVVGRHTRLRERAPPREAPTAKLAFEGEALVGQEVAGHRRSKTGGRVTCLRGATGMQSYACGGGPQVSLACAIGSSQIASPRVRRKPRCFLAKWRVSRWVSRIASSSGSSPSRWAARCS